MADNNDKKIPHGTLTKAANQLGVSINYVKAVYEGKHTETERTIAILLVINACAEEIRAKQGNLKQRGDEIRRVCAL